MFTVQNWYPICLHVVTRASKYGMAMSANACGALGTKKWCVKTHATRMQMYAGKMGNRQRIGVCEWEWMQYRCGRVFISFAERWVSCRCFIYNWGSVIIKINVRWIWRKPKLAVRATNSLRQVLGRMPRGVPTHNFAVDSKCIRWMYGLLVAAVISDLHTACAVQMRGGPKDQYYLLENWPRHCSTVHTRYWDAPACFCCLTVIVGSVNANESKGRRVGCFWYAMFSMGTDGTKYWGSHIPNRAVNTTERSHFSSLPLRYRYSASFTESV
jgi:hypothetical protein